MLRPIITQVRSPLARRGEKTSGKGGNGGGDDMRAERVSLYKGCHLQPRIPIPPPTITNTPQTTPSAIHHRAYALSLYFSLFFEIYILRSLYAPRSRQYGECFIVIVIVSECFTGFCSDTGPFGESGINDCEFESGLLFLISV